MRFITLAFVIGCMFILSCGEERENSDPLPSDPLPACTQSSGTFSTAVIYDLPAKPYFIAAGDLNGNGRIDLVAVNYETNSYSVLLNNGDRSFAQPVEYPAGNQPMNPILAYIDSDESIDLVMAHPGQGVSVYLGNNDGTFAPGINFPVANYNYNGILLVEDIDGDGNLDLITGGELDSVSWTRDVNVLLGDGTGTFAPPIASPAGVNVHSSASGYLDGDEYIDLALANATSPTTSELQVLSGLGNGRFDISATYSTGAWGTFEGSLLIGDLDNDSVQDIAYANTEDNNFSVFINYGDGTFAPPVNYATDLPNALAMGDFNCDQSLDLSVTNWNSGTVTIFLNNADGTFASGVSYPTIDFPYRMLVADLDRDGILDMVVTSWNADSNKIAVLFGE